MKHNNYLEWVNKAEQDFKAAIYLNTKEGERKLADQICFLCQQTGEKYLKAFIVYNRTEPPFSHDLFNLTNLCISKDSEFSEIIDLVKTMTSYATEYRYPGISALDEEAEDALQRTEKIRLFIRKKLGLRD